MPLCTSYEMRNDHALSGLSWLRDLMRSWHKRAAGRRELARWTERDLNDVGLTRDDVELEIAKPFWRA